MGILIGLLAGAFLLTRAKSPSVTPVSPNVVSKTVQTPVAVKPLIQTASPGLSMPVSQFNAGLGLVAQVDAPLDVSTTLEPSLVVIPPVVTVQPPPVIAPTVQAPVDAPTGYVALNFVRADGTKLSVTSEATRIEKTKDSVLWQNPGATYVGMTQIS